MTEPDTHWQPPPDRRNSGDVEQLFREHNASLLRFISARVGSEQEAREIAQEAYVHLLRLNQPGAVSHLRAYLFKTAANLAIDRIRQRGRRAFTVTTSNLDFAVFELTPERQLSGEQALGVVRASVAQLPAKCRQAFLLHRVQGLAIDDIARQMGIGDCMVRRYVARGLEYVREQLDRQGYDPVGRAL